MMGCVWHDSNLTTAYIGAHYFTRFPSQDSPHQLGGGSRSVVAKRGESFRATQTGTPGDAHFFSGLVLPFFICLLLLTVAFSLRQVIPGYIPVAPR